MPNTKIKLAENCRKIITSFILNVFSVDFCCKRGFFVRPWNPHYDGGGLFVKENLLMTFNWPLSSL